MKVKYEPSKEPEKFRSNKGVANQFSIPGSTFTTWKKNKKKNLWSFSKFITETTIVKNGTNKKLNDALLKWFTLMRGNNIPINGAILLEKARDSAKVFNCNDFKHQTDGWEAEWYFLEF